MRQDQAQGPPQRGHARDRCHRWSGDWQSDAQGRGLRRALLGSDHPTGRRTGALRRRRPSFHVRLDLPGERGRSRPGAAALPRPSRCSRTSSANSMARIPDDTLHSARNDALALIDGFQSTCTGTAWSSSGSSRHWSPYGPPKTAAARPGVSSFPERCRWSLTDGDRPSSSRSSPMSATFAESGRARSGVGFHHGVVGAGGRCPPPRRRG